MRKENIYLIDNKKIKYKIDHRRYPHTHVIYSIPLISHSKHLPANESLTTFILGWQINSLVFKRGIKHNFLYIRYKIN